MSSTIKVNNIQNLAGDDSGIDLSTNDQIILKTANTSAITINSSQVATFAQPPVGTFISQADMFRLTANQSGQVNADITANLERVDDASFSKIGTGMTESSGIFTFPSTGLYFVILNCAINSQSDANSMVGAQVSTNSGGAFDDVALLNAGEQGSGDSGVTAYSHFFVNVTNTSTFQVKFLTTSMGQHSFLQGDTNQNFTTFTFIKLGESQ